MLLAMPCAVLADSATAVDQPEDAQTYCAGPVQAFARALEQINPNQGVDEPLRDQFLQDLEQCRTVYRYQLTRLADDFTDLPAGAYCHSVRREFIESEDLFDIAAARAQQLPLESEEERGVAADFFLQAGAALVRAVNGLFLLRHGICEEERIAPFDQHPFKNDIGRTYPHIQ